MFFYTNWMKFLVLTREQKLLLTTKRTSRWKTTANDIIGRYYFINEDDVPVRQRCVEESKYPKKLGVWMAMSRDNRTSLHFFDPQKGESINKTSYLNILRKHLPTLIDGDNNGRKFIFWPDKASAHYAKEVVEEISENFNCVFIPRDCNPTNAPQLRPIEDFWAILKAKVFNNGWVAKSLEQLQRRIRESAKKIDDLTIFTMMGRVREKVKHAKSVGLENVIH